MQKQKRKMIILLTIGICVFVCLIICLIYQYSVIHSLNNDLKTTESELNFVDEKIELTNETIEEVQQRSYIEKWARQYLNFAYENEIRFLF